MRKLVPLLALLALAPTAPASASPGSLDTTLSLRGTADRSCSARLRGAGPATALRTVAPARTGWITARMRGGRGDWDLAVFDRASGRLVAGSAGFGTREVASGFVAGGAPLVVQACRRSGPARRAALSVRTTAVQADPTARPRLLGLDGLTRDQMTELARTGLDVEPTGVGSAEVVAYGDRDVDVLRGLKLPFRVEVPDLIAQSTQQRKRDRAFALETRRSGLPSGRTTYRRLADYGEDMKKLVAANPGLVKPITLPFKTWEGRQVQGIEITTDVHERDGKPVFLQMGTHHAREWPSAEHTMEWAFELVDGYRSGDPRATRLVKATRTIVIPVVNPDGFNISREAGELQGAGGGRAGASEIANLALLYEYHRKNCRKRDNSESGDCLGQPGNGIFHFGVDPNRNYGAFWGGAGASGSTISAVYWGTGPFSEPETRNIRDLVSKRHVTTLITNHTYSDLVLRPPGVASQGDPFDEPVYKKLGDDMASRNGYLSLKGFQLYDTTGTTEDWTYTATAGLGFTFEIGCVTLDRENLECDHGHFHPPFADMVKEWTGGTEQAKPGTVKNGQEEHEVVGGGNREAYYVAQENTADPSKHAVVEGQAPEGSVLRLSKSFQTATSRTDADGNPVTFDDRLDTVMEVGPGGSFEWHVNPSTRPHVAKGSGREATGVPSPPGSFGGAPGPSAIPCPGYFPLVSGQPETKGAECHNEHAFTVEQGNGIDNETVTVTVDWESGMSDWDVEVYRDENANGAVDPGEPIAGKSTTGNHPENAEVLLGGKGAGQYIVRVINWAAAEPYAGKITFGGPPPYVPPATEEWTLTCERQDRTVLETRGVTIARGERLDLGDVCGGATTAGASSDSGSGAAASPVVVSGSLPAPAKQRPSGGGDSRPSGSGAAPRMLFAYRLDRRPLSRALRHGVRARSRCSAPCRPAVALMVDRKTKKRYGLRSAIVARGGSRELAAGRRKFAVRFSREARAKLRRAKAVQLRLVAVTTGAGGQRGVTRARYTLSR